MEGIKSKKEKVLDLGIVNRTLVKKMQSLDSAVRDLTRSIKKNDETATDLVDAVNREVFAVSCLADAVTDKGEIVHCANWILSHLKTGFYYDRHKVILAGEDEHYFLGDINRALSVLESSGIIGSKAISETATIYLTEKHHGWIVADLDPEGTR